MKKRLNNKYVLVSCILVIFVSLLAFSFADTSYAVNYTVGENGTVNNKGGEFIEEYVDTQEGYPIVITPEEGYMVDKIVVDGEENEEYTTAAQSTLNYIIEDLNITKDTDIEVTFKEIDNPALAEASEGFIIKATSEGPGDVITVFENDEGKYLSTDEEEDRTITWVSDADNNAIVKSVTINGVEDQSFAGKTNGKYIATSGDIDIKVVFEVSSTPLPNDDEEEFTVTTSAQSGGDITDGYTYTVDEDNTEHEIVYYADSGYYIDTVKINGVEKSVNDNVGIGEEQGVYTFKTGNQTVDVTFTATASVNSDAGKVSLTPDKTEINKYDEVTFKISFEPKNTSVDSTYDINISDFDFVSSDKGELKDNVVSGTIKSGTEKEEVVLKVKYGDGTLDGVVTATLHNGGKVAENESDLFLIREDDDMSAPAEDDIILDHSDILDEEGWNDTDNVDEESGTTDKTSNDKTSSNKDKSSVKTGDETNNSIFYVLGILALVVLASVVIIKRRINRKIE